MKSAPEVVLQQLTSKCKKCVAESCTCMRNKVKFSAVCYSFACENENYNADSEDNDMFLFSNDENESDVDDDGENIN